MDNQILPLTGDLISFHFHSRCISGKMSLLQDILNGKSVLGDNDNSEAKNDIGNRKRGRALNEIVEDERPAKKYVPMVWTKTLKRRIFTLTYSAILKGRQPHRLHSLFI